MLACCGAGRRGRVPGRVHGRSVAGISEVDLEARRLRRWPRGRTALASFCVLARLGEEGVLRQQVSRGLLAVGASQVAGGQGTCGGPQEAHHAVLAAPREFGVQHVEQVEQHGPGAGPGIAAGGHLDVVTMERFERVFPDTDHGASCVSQRCLGVSGLPVISLLVVLAFLLATAAPRRAGTRASRRLAKPSPIDVFCPGQRVSAPPSVSAWAVHHGGSFFYRARSYSWSFACNAYFPRIPPTAWLGGATFAVPENARLPGERRNSPQNQGDTGSTRDSIAILPPARPGRPRASAAVTDSPTCTHSQALPSLGASSQNLLSREMNLRSAV